jgi:hypothetical protein
MSTFVIRFSSTPQFRYVVSGSPPGGGGGGGGGGGSPPSGDASTGSPAGPMPDAASWMRFLVNVVSQQGLDDAAPPPTHLPASKAALSALSRGVWHDAYAHEARLGMPECTVSWSVSTPSPADSKPAVCLAATCHVSHEPRSKSCRS